MEGKDPFKSEGQRIAPDKLPKRSRRNDPEAARAPEGIIVGRVITLRITKEEHEAVKQAARIASLDNKATVSMNALCVDAVIERVNAIFHAEEERINAATAQQ